MQPCVVHISTAYSLAPNHVRRHPKESKRRLTRLQKGRLIRVWTKWCGYANFRMGTFIDFFFRWDGTCFESSIKLLALPFLCVQGRGLRCTYSAVLRAVGGGAGARLASLAASLEGHLTWGLFHHNELNICRQYSNKKRTKIALSIFLSIELTLLGFFY